MSRVLKKFDPTKLLKESPEGVDKVQCPHCHAEDDNWVGTDVNMAAYQSFGEGDYGTYDSEIGSYEYVQCGSCDRLVWYDPEWYRADREIDELLKAAEHGLVVELGGTLETPEAALDWLKLTLAGHRLSALLNEVGEEP